MTNQSADQPSPTIHSSQNEMTPAQRRKADKKAEEPFRYKVTYDLTQNIADAIYAVALDLKCSLSDVAMALLCDGLTHYYAGELDLKKRQIPHRFSLRFTYKLSPPQIPVPGRTEDKEVTPNDKLLD
jgi:hypothetical protein